MHGLHKQKGGRAHNAQSIKHSFPCLELDDFGDRFREKKRTALSVFRLCSVISSPLSAFTCVVKISKLQFIQKKSKQVRNCSLAGIHVHTMQFSKIYRVHTAQVSSFSVS